MRGGSSESILRGTEKLPGKGFTISSKTGTQLASNVWLPDTETEATVSGPRVEKSVLALRGTQGFCTPAMAQQAQQAVQLRADPAVAFVVKQLSLRGLGRTHHLKNAKPEPSFPETGNSQGAWRFHLTKQVRARKKYCPCHYCDLAFVSSVWSSPGHPN